MRVETYEKDIITKTLKECNHVKAQAAKKLGITERMIGYKIKKNIKVLKGDIESNDY
ncbi:MAG: helix-turn-helix domain-containing protein [Nitrospiraceae bacterium]|nr:MAG: helix-turn-helix domain-containing protein [Nitrospiraceae bacterium]